LYEKQYFNEVSKINLIPSYQDLAPLNLAKSLSLSNLTYACFPQPCKKTNLRLSLINATKKTAVIHHWTCLFKDKSKMI
jgi:hypothetical protein